MDLDTIPSNVFTRRYERDFLLQLRLHPFSLQKPKSLKSHEIVKDKLYLHQMDNCSGYPNTNLLNSRSASQASIKSDPEMMFRSNRILPECYPRSCPLYAPGYKCNAGYHGSSKSRPFYVPDFINPLQKCTVPPPSEYNKFDLLEDIFSPNWPASQTVPWSKQGSYEELWNSYNRPLQNKASKDNCEVPVKGKKTLPIIDPSNGKNILEGIISSPRVSQESIEQNDSEMKSLALSPEVDVQICDTAEGSSVSAARSNEYEVISKSSGEEFCMPQNSERLEKSRDLYLVSDEGGPRELCSQKDIKFKNSRGNGLDINKEETLGKSNIDISTKRQMIDYENKLSYSNCEEFTAANIKNTDNTQADKENHYNQILSHNVRNSGVFPLRDGVTKNEEQLKANVAVLKEKLYSIRQEQQKMVIYQSFLRYKKHQLDEIVRSLDEQKIEIANWECNLVSKEKRLKDKDSWLEIKRNNLKIKEDELREKERKLSKELSVNVDDQSREVENTLNINIEGESKESGASFHELGDSLQVTGKGNPEVDVGKTSSKNGKHSDAVDGMISPRKHRPDYGYTYEHIKNAS